MSLTHALLFLLCLIETGHLVLKGYEMSTTPPGLAALQAAATALTTAINNAVAEIQALAAQLSGNEDAQVQAIAGNLSTLATNLQAAVTAATPAPPPAS
jgi:hypothetical protein